jgi:hypothetical protein
MVAVRYFPIFLSVCALGCAFQSSDSTEESESEVGTVYVSADTYLKSAQDSAGWAAAKANIDGEFDNVCGDTFCSGDYSNLTSMGLVCAVSSARGIIKDCAWTFVGSSHLVNGATGTVQASIASFQCHFKPSGGVKALSTRLQGNDAIRQTLPGVNRSIYDVLGDCFQNPIGATPIDFADGPYVDAPDSSAVDQDRWFDAARGVRNAFDSTHADANVHALRFVCSVRSTTGTIRSCKWLFGGATSKVDSKSGAVVITATSDRCTVPATGKANDLTVGLTASGPTPILDRTLPGSTKTLNDVLASCL